MNSSFASVKIRPPQVSRILTRRRLLDALDLNSDKKIVLLLGQAAQGKSTLAASFVETCPRPFAWINLDAEESNPVNLFRLVVQAVQQAMPKEDLSQIFQYLAMDLGPRAEGPLYQGWVQALIEKIPGPIQFVLDGLERLAPEAPSYRLIQVLLDESNAHMRFLLLSRTEPPLNLQNLQMKQQAALIGNEQLAFTRFETETFFRTLHGLSMPAEQLTKVHELTEGWVGGLILYSEALKRSRGDQRQRLLLEEPIANFTKEAFRYLGDEIFSTMGKTENDFLIKSSILEVIDPIAIRDLFETNNAHALLNELAGKNLFIQSLYDPKSGWMYRYHHLFRDFLRSRFDSEIPVKDQHRFFAKAGDVYARNASYENAINFYLKANSYRKASKNIEHIGMTLLMSGRVADLADWLRKVPEALIQKRPWLLYFLCMTRRYTAAMENSRALLKCLGTFEEKGDIRGQILSAAFLIEAFALGGYHSIPITGLVAQAEKLLEGTPQDYESGVLWLHLGMGMTFSCGNPRRGFWCFKKASLIAGHYGDVNLQFAAMNHAVEALAWIGEFDMADTVVSELDSFLEASTYQELRTYQMIALASLSMLRGEISKAKEKIQKAYALIEKHGLIPWYAPALAADLIINVYAGELDKALDMANQMHDFASSMHNRVFEGIALFNKGLILSHKRQWKQAGANIEKAMQILSSDESLTLYHYHAAVILRSRIRVNSNGLPENIEDLRKTIAYLRAMPAYINLIDAHLCMAFIEHKHRKKAETAHHLEEAFRLAREKKHYHTALLNREDLADACVLVLALNISKAAEYAVCLLINNLADLADQRLKALEHHPDAKVQVRARELRKNIYRKNLAPIRIECFGQFKIWRGDTPMEDDEWPRLRSKLLLKAILARGARQVEREVLMEDLWPENDPRAAEMNLKVTLHRLRKALEPTIKKEYGSFYLHLKENQVALDKALCTIDVEEFTNLVRLGSEEESRKNTKKAIQLYTRAADLYTGDFLGDDPYLTFAEDRRSELRNTYIDVLFRVAQLYETQGKTKSAIKYYQKVIKAEPVMEVAYQKAMTLYGACGMRTSAVKMYRDFEKMLKVHYQCEPDHATQAIYRNIAGPASSK
jgi:LuxR family transcriptional regulator, maltose regulon positive regulatory protein